MDYKPTRLLCPCDFPCKDIGVGSHSLLQGIFLTQGLNFISCIDGGFFITEPPRKLSNFQFSSVQLLSRVQLCDPMDRSTPGLPVHHQLPEFTQTHIHRTSDDISHLILCRPLFLLPPIPPSIRVFSNESTLRVRWPKCWSFSFSIIPSKEIPGLISFRMDWLDLLAV